MTSLYLFMKLCNHFTIVISVSSHDSLSFCPTVAILSSSDSLDNREKSNHSLLFSNDFYFVGFDELSMTESISLPHSTLAFPLGGSFHRSKFRPHPTRSLVYLCFLSLSTFSSLTKSTDWNSKGVVNPVHDET